MSSGHKRASDFSNPQNSKRRMITGSTPVQKPASNVSMEAIDCIDKFLEKISNLKPSKDSEIEIELRLGCILGEKFRSGVTLSFFEDYRNQLTARPSTTITKIDDTDYCYATNTNFDRLTVNNLNGERYAITKQKLHSPVNITSRFDFDVRISDARETLKQIDTTDIPEDWRQKRRKERMQFDVQQYVWMIHLTKVTTVEKDREEETITFEIEFELKDTPRVTEVTYRKYSASQIWKQILLPLMGKPEDRLELFLSPVNSNDIRIIQQYVWEGVRPAPQVGQRNESFPGSMPVSFSRRHFGNLQAAPYFISEKTDGIRYMMMIMSNAIVMIGRSFDVHCLHGYEMMSREFGAKGHTLLDGELVETLIGGVPSLTFMIFDVLKIKGKHIGKYPLSSRLPAIGDIVKWYRNVFMKSPDSTKAPFSLIGKKFVVKDDFATLQASVKKIQNGNHVERFYIDDKRHHKTDGFIFTPDEPYHPKGTPNLYKWKYCDLLSIDFRILPNNKMGSDLPLAFYCAGSGEETVYCRAMDLLQADDDAVKKVLESRRQLCEFGYDDRYQWLYKETVILEMTYDPQAGAWRYHLERRDKPKGNHISVVFDTMEAIAENLTEKELAKRLTNPK